VAILCSRQLCAACLHGALRPLLDDGEFAVYGREEELLTDVAAGMRPDVVLVSAISPASLDFAALERLGRQLSEVPLAVHVDMVDAALAGTIIACGAKGVIPTTVSPRIAAAALRLIAAGGIFLPTEPPGAPPPRAAASAGRRGIAQALTERQRTVLRLTAAGKTNKEIARELGLTQNTVKVHIARLMRRLQVGNRVGLALIAARVLAEK
jgi:DNA-binding NarL/FixJ family response regulator